MYTRTYNLNRERYINDFDLIKNALLNLDGVSEVEILKDAEGLTVNFDNSLSEKQILSIINNFKVKH
ncbi:MAG: hypothetical protein K0R84_1224 [Clostridia bacterium]|jgi:copper chaperone CopZ|nr:hypothetical protein [Clostridia bacterium]